jgi:tetratricopeptide (TPR) repeat protein
MRISLTRTTATLFALAVFVSAGSAFADQALDDAVRGIQHQWAHINYEVSGDDAKSTAFATLEGQADALMTRYPDRAEPRIWKAITLSTHAGAKGGLGALSLARQARDLLIEAEKIDPNAMNGSIYTSLGSLYYKVPGWPIGFGDKDKAEAMLKKALALNPAGIDPNYFYADYLYERGRYQEAMSAAQKALAAPDRSNRPLADKGRREELRALLGKIQSEIKA